MPTIAPSPLPPDTLLAHYRSTGAYTDCYATDIPSVVTHAEFVEAFYTTTVFAVERVLLKWFAGRPSTHADARALAVGASDAFAAWRVEARAADQLLLADLTGRTRSWLMVAPLAAGGTRLYFGSAVVPAKGGQSMGLVFHLLLGFHKLYSRILLSAAKRALAQRIH